MKPPPLRKRLKSLLGFEIAENVWKRRLWGSPEADYLVNEQFGILYCAIPKTGCTSVKWWFRSLFPCEANSASIDALPDQIHTYMAAKELRRCKLATQFRAMKSRQYFRFTVVRNPWSRLVLAFCNKFVNNEFVGARRLFDNADDLSDVTFRQFVARISDCPPTELNGHWRPQCLFLRGHHFHEIGRFERLEAFMDRLSDRLGVERLRWRRNRTRYGRPLSDPHQSFCDHAVHQLRAFDHQPSYEFFYDDQLQEQVAKYYEADIARFGYQFARRDHRRSASTA